jgi:hypothetical protein
MFNIVGLENASVGELILLRACASVITNPTISFADLKQEIVSNVLGSVKHS